MAGPPAAERCARPRTVPVGVPACCCRRGIGTRSHEGRTCRALSREFFRCVMSRPSARGRTGQRRLSAAAGLADGDALVSLDRLDGGLTVGRDLRPLGIALADTLRPHRARRAVRPADTFVGIGVEPPVDFRRKDFRIRVSLRRRGRPGAPRNPAGKRQDNRQETGILGGFWHARDGSTNPGGQANQRAQGLALPARQRTALYQRYVQLRGRPISAGEALCGPVAKTQQITKR